MSLNFVEKYVRLSKWKKKKVNVIITITTEFAWMYLYKQTSEYAWGPKYPKILNMAGFSKCEQYAVFQICHNMSWQWWICLRFLICQDYGYGRVLNMQELHRVLNMPQYGWLCLNRTWICHMSKFMITNRVLNMYHTIHSARSLFKLLSNYW